LFDLWFKIEESYTEIRGDWFWVKHEFRGFHEFVKNWRVGFRFAGYYVNLRGMVSRSIPDVLQNFVTLAL
jgi:hypothetical protein